MHSLLVIALLLTLLSAPTAAMSPPLDPILPPAPMTSFYPDPDRLLDFCNICGPLEMCIHEVNPQAFMPETFLSHHEWPGSTLPMPYLDPLLVGQPSVSLHDDSSVNPQAVFQWQLSQINDEAVAVRNDTVLEHVKDTYNAGDRITLPSESRNQPVRRQAPRPGGFPCRVEGCGKAFDRSCDLNRHQKTHLGRSKRPHKCSRCGEGFLYPKDRSRHERTHDQSASPQPNLQCGMPGCSNTDGFSRRDNLLRHQRKQHPHLVQHLVRAS